MLDVSLPSDNPVLDARSLCFPADGSVLHQVNLAVGEGETVAVLGPAQAGKSVLLRCLTGQLTPGSGSIWANGKAFHLFSAEQKRAFQRRTYGLVPQNTGFVPELTLEQNAALPLIFAGVARETAVRRARVWLERFELGEDVGRRAEGLPQETLRRAALARGMVTDPLVLFADEPLAGLHNPSVGAIARMLLSIARSHGTSVLLFTREAALAERFQRQVDLAHGRTPNQPVPAAPPATPRAPKPVLSQPTVLPKAVIVTTPTGQLVRKQDGVRVGQAGSASAQEPVGSSVAHSAQGSNDPLSPIGPVTRVGPVSPVGAVSPVTSAASRSATSSASPVTPAVSRSAANPNSSSEPVRQAMPTGSASSASSAGPASPASAPYPHNSFSPPTLPKDPLSRGGLPLGAPSYLTATSPEAKR